MADIPPPTSKPCSECPWRRAAWAGWLGPYTAERWVEIAHSDAPVACHKTIRESGSWDGAFQCRGLASFRANVCKMPRDEAVETGPVDHSAVFSTGSEFMAHHDGGL